MSEYTELAQHLETVHSWRQPREFFNLNQLRRIHSFFVSCPDRPVSSICHHTIEEGCTGHGDF